MQYTVSPLFTDEYLVARYKTGKPDVRSILRGFVRRLLLSHNFDQYDLVVIEKELVPYMPVHFEQLFLKKMRAYTLDIDDALFHIYDQHRSTLIKSILHDKYSRLMSGASLITAGNSYIASYSRQYTGKVELLPTVVDIAKYQADQGPGERVFTIGWIGTPNTQKYLQLIAGPLRRFFRRRKGCLLVVGANAEFRLNGVPIVTVPWSEESEISLLRSMDVGIMPLPDLPLERGKSGLKLLQYMACRKPVVASPVGVNSELVSTKTGFLVGDDDMWFSSLLSLADNPALRDAMGLEGRRLVEEKYTLTQWAPRYAQMLFEAVRVDGKASRPRVSNGSN